MKYITRWRAPMALLLSLWAGAVPASQVRLKDLVQLQGMRDNELFGYGLVVGLSGTGDTERTFFTSQSISGMLGRLGIRVDAREIRSRNVAAVIVTARLPTFSKPGTRLDVHVSSMGNARSISGGVLLLTPLSGPDGQVYAVSQGPVQVGGYEAAAAGSSVRKNQTTVGRVPMGAVIEREVAPNLTAGPMTLGLKRPDFTTASRIAEAVEKVLGQATAKAVSPAAVEIPIPDTYKENPVGLMAKLEEIVVDADQKAKVVVSERTGTVVAGQFVRIRPAAVAHGGLQVSIAQMPIVSQPVASFSNSGQTVVVPRAAIEANDINQRAVALPATTSVDDLVKALNVLGATPRDLISILQALEAAGALDAELEVL